MYDVLAALNAALIPMAGIFLLVFTEYQWKSRNDKQGTALSRFGWSLFCISLGVFFSSVLYFLWDFDIIYKSTQYKLSIIPRGFFIAGLAIGFHALEIRWHKTICITALCLALGVLISRVLW